MAMRKYRVEGADKESGEEMELVVEATDEQGAVVKAGRRGLLVSSCHEIGSGNQKAAQGAATTAAASPPIAPMRGSGGGIRVATGALVVIGGAAVLLWSFNHPHPAATAPTPPATPAPPTATVDPTSSFQSIASGFVERLRKEADGYGRIGSAGIDVRRNDSLVSPYIGILTVPISGIVDRKYDCTFVFAMTDGKWALRSGTARETSTLDPDYSSQVDLLGGNDENLVILYVNRVREAVGL